MTNNQRKSDYTAGTLRPTDTRDMYPGDLPSPSVIFVGGLVACAVVIIGGLMLAGWLAG